MNISDPSQNRHIGSLPPGELGSLILYDTVSYFDASAAPIHGTSLGRWIVAFARREL